MRLPQVRSESYLLVCAKGGGLRDWERRCYSELSWGDILHTDLVHLSRTCHFQRRGRRKRTRSCWSSLTVKVWMNSKSRSLWTNKEDMKRKILWAALCQMKCVTRTWIIDSVRGKQKGAETLHRCIEWNVYHVFCTSEWFEICCTTTGILLCVYFSLRKCLIKLCVERMKIKLVVLLNLNVHRWGKGKTTLKGNGDLIKQCGTFEKNKSCTLTCCNNSSALNVCSLLRKVCTL